jgi:hypothetical protein
MALRLLLQWLAVLVSDYRMLYNHHCLYTCLETILELHACFHIIMCKYVFYEEM